LVLVFAVPRFTVEAFPQATEAVPIRVTSRLVSLDVMVMDKRTGARIDTLTQDDFQVFDRGRPQVITNFSPTAGPTRPLALVLLVESNVFTAGMTQSLPATLAPTLNRLKPEDEVAVVRFLPGAEIVRSLTRDRESIASALADVAAQAQKQVKDKKKRKSEKFDIQRDPALALLLAARHVREHSPNSRLALVMITEDFDIAPTKVVVETAKQLVASGASVSGLIRITSKLVAGFKTVVHVLFLRPDIRWKAMDENVVYYSQQTGGEIIKINRDEEFGAALESVVGDLIGRYSLAFIPDPNYLDGQYHTLEVKVKIPPDLGESRDLVIRARRGYFAWKENGEAAAGIKADEVVDDMPADRTVKRSDVPDVPTVHYKGVAGWVEVQPTVAEQMKIRDVGKSMVSMGIIRPQLVMSYHGQRASLQIAEARPAFYVRQPVEPSATIVRLDQKKDHRESRLSIQLEPKTRLDVTVAVMPGGIFRVAPKSDLKPGEYLLFLDEYGLAVYDFGISPRSASSVKRR
jgi:VWFA-related protein